MNRHTITGRLTADPVVRNYKERTVVNFTVACDKGMNKEQRAAAEKEGRKTADFFRVSVWGTQKRADSLMKYLQKGLLVLVSGRGVESSYMQDNVQKYSYQIDADEVEFLEWPDEPKQKQQPMQQPMQQQPMQQQPMQQQPMQQQPMQQQPMQQQPMQQQPMQQQPMQQQPMQQQPMQQPMQQQQAPEMPYLEVDDSDIPF